MKNDHRRVVDIVHKELSDVMEGKATTRDAEEYPLESGDETAPEMTSLWYYARREPSLKILKIVSAGWMLVYCSRPGYAANAPTLCDAMANMNAKS